MQEQPAFEFADDIRDKRIRLTMQKRPPGWYFNRRCSHPKCARSLVCIPPGAVDPVPEFEVVASGLLCPEHWADARGWVRCRVCTDVRGRVPGKVKQLVPCEDCAGFGYHVNLGEW